MVNWEIQILDMTSSHLTSISTLQTFLVLCLTLPVQSSCPFKQSINSEYFIALLICLHVLFHPLPGLFYTLNSSHLIFLMHGERHLSSYLHCQSSSSSVLIQVCPYSRFPIHKSSSQRCDRTHHVLKSWKILKSRSSRVWAPSEGWDWGAWHVFSLPVLILVFVAAETFWRSKSVLCLRKKRMFC